MRILLLFFITFFSNFVLADYTWWHSGSSGSDGPHPSISAACSDYVSKRPADWGASLDGSRPGTTVTTGICDITYATRYSTPSTSTSTIYRKGTECHPDSTYNQNTGECEYPPEDCKVGDLFPSKGSTGPVVSGSSGAKHVISSPRTMCQNRCQYADPSARPSGCYAISDTEGYCNFIIKGTGNSCGADSYEFSKAGTPLNPPDTPNVPDSSPDPVCPPGWSSSNGTCFKNPPKYCDPSTGEICAPGTTDPNKPPPDPGTGGTPGTPGEGDGGRPDSSDGADKDLSDLESSKPDAEACKPNADGTGCSGSTVKGEQCDKVVECTGDAVHCSILRQQKKMACAYEYEDARPFIEQQIAKEPYQVKSESVSGSELFSAGLNAPRWMPQGCPAPKSISIKGVSTSLSFEPACDFARGLGPLFVALASIFFAVYVGRAFGGN
jgi:hypothetical protein